MSKNETTLLTQHAMLVTWGEHAQSIGLVTESDSVESSWLDEATP